MKGQLGNAMAAIKANRLRSALTISIIAIGVTALVGIETAIGALGRELSGSFGRLGAGRYSMVPEAPDAKGGTAPRPFSWSEVSALAAGFEGCGAPLLSLSALVSQTAVVAAGERRTDPMVSVVAADAAYLALSGKELAEGRNFTAREAAAGSGVCLVGSSLARRLFAAGGPVPGSTLAFSGRSYTVIGVLEPEGSLTGTGNGNTLILPLADGRRWLQESEPEWQILLMGDAGSGYTDGRLLEEARTLMRTLRRLPPGAPDDFTFRRSDALQQRLDSLERKLSLAALAVGLVTLLGATVALMNILLVSVRERTREIGLRKALGERTSSIRRQFLVESVLIGQMGGAAGIVLGLLAGAGVALALGGGWHVPWGWLAVALGLCVVVSLSAGTLPARRAAALQPVDALRGR